VVVAAAKPKYIIGHFDGHGVSTTAARARSLGVPAERVYSRFPVTGPEQLPYYIDGHFHMLAQHDVEIVDIPVNLKDPRTFIDAVNRLAASTPVALYDHHKTSRQFAAQMLARVVIFDSGVEMAEALVDQENLMLAFIGVVSDRDTSILSRVSRDEVEGELLPLANKLDVIVRQDAEKAVKDLTSASDPVAYIRGVSAGYPPEVLARQVEIRRKGVNTVLVDMTRIPAQQVVGWGWKVMELVALQHGVDYVAAVAEGFDRKANQYVPTVMVIRYWLSGKPSPRPVLAPVIGRVTIGHDNAFSVHATDADDARSLAERVFDELESTTPKTTANPHISKQHTRPE
jgi:hypothetical protein